MKDNLPITTKPPILPELLEKQLQSYRYEIASCFQDAMNNVLKSSELPLPHL